MKAMVVLAATPFVAPVLAKTAVMAQMTLRQTVRAVVLPSRILRRPSRSTKRLPAKAQAAEQTVFSALISSCSVTEVMPAFSSMTGRK